MNKERDKFITEKILGECWHDWRYMTKEEIPAKWVGTGYICPKCSKRRVRPTKHRTFSTGDEFFLLLDACKEKDWWNDFLSSTIRVTRMDSEAAIYAKVLYQTVDLLHKDRLADAVYNYLKEIQI